MTLAYTNAQMTAMLGLYRLEGDAVLNLSEVYVHDMLNSAIELLPGNIKVSCECDEMLTALFDEQLVKAAVVDALHNALRYAASQVILSAAFDDKQLVLKVEDDGPGFGDAAAPDGTGLGQHFARMVAKAHHKNGARGELKLKQSTRLGGACWSLHLS